MATPKSLSSLEKSKDAILLIRKRILPVLERLGNNEFGEATDRAKASVSLSIGMMRYMGARLRGLDQGRRPDDPLRKDLNNIKRVLAKTKKSNSPVTSKPKPNTKVPTTSIVNRKVDSRTSGSLDAHQNHEDPILKKDSESKIEKMASFKNTVHKKKTKAKFVVNKKQSAFKKSRK